jgi:16S rRNA (guanine1516-N2)-methyltransferase
MLEDVVGQWLSLHRDASVTIECGDGIARITEGTFDVIYLDPMFPLRSKSALPGKRLQYLHELVGETRDVDAALLERARRSATARVVLKRRRTDPVLAAPDWQIVEKSVRFDVYRSLTT